MKRFGVHSSIAGGLHLALVRGHELGCEAIQMFSHNPRGWRITPITSEEAGLFIKTRKELGIDPVAVHTSYLLNLASPDAALRQRSIEALTEEMRRAQMIGADFVVLHTGTAHDGKGMERAARSIRQALKGYKGKTRLLLENTSGKRGDITSRMDELGRLLKLTKGAASGVCIDSCHAFAAGYDLSRPKGMKELETEVLELLGPDAVRLLHLNDSKGEMGSGTDRHDHIGKGLIGNAGLRRFLKSKAFRKAHVILETPQKTQKDDKMNLARARALL